VDGRIAAVRGDYASALKHLRSAAAAEDQLAYDEPPNWYYPVRETLGAVLLKGNDPVAAEAVFRDDLSRRPRNPRALFGLKQSLIAQGRGEEAMLVSRQISRAWKGDKAQLSLLSF